MRLGVLTVPLSALPLEEALDYLRTLGVETVELGTGGFPGSAHCNPDILLGNPAALREFRRTIDRSGMVISALSCHGNPVHPQQEVALAAGEAFEKTVRLAAELGVDTVVTFSGCPGDCPGSRYPNWVTCPWPEDFQHILDYQWNQCLLPYWRRAEAFARAHGINRIAIEMHPGFCVYNTETMLRLRREIGPSLGANFDPSHLMWQQMDPLAVIRALGSCIFHVHAKDCFVDPANTAVCGVLDCKHYSREAERSWLFRTVGYGHGESDWRNMLCALRLAGYDGAVSIEHEDSIFSVREGLEKAISFLGGLLPREKPSKMWWA